jgi:hypothetical protein
MKPYKEWLSEDYPIFSYPRNYRSPSVTDLIHQPGLHIAQVVRGDMGQLAESECNEVLQSRISYYANDLTVLGWNAAFIYDSTSGAETAIQLLEYANSQLLEFRHYDNLLTRELERVYTLLDEGTGFLRNGGWRGRRLDCIRCFWMWRSLRSTPITPSNFLVICFRRAFISWRL